MLFVSWSLLIQFKKNICIMQASEEELRTKRHVVHHLHLHLVFVTKYRKKVFSEKMYERLRFHFDRVCKDFGCSLVECDGEL
ncbi:MAG TPA: hypothetical protein ENO05_13125 [Bacteroides sp.]|nr:hypothetical protein [Bacteroides sp.]